MVEIEGDGCGDTDGEEKGVSAPIIESDEVLPVFEFGEEIFALGELAVECLVAVERHLPVFGRRNAGRYSALRQRFMNPVAVITLSPIGVIDADKVPGLIRAPL